MLLKADVGLPFGAISFCGSRTNFHRIQIPTRDYKKLKDSNKKKREKATGGATPHFSPINPLIFQEGWTACLRTLLRCYHFGLRKRADKRVMIFIQRDIGKQKTRRQVSKHPFGAIKHADGLRRFLCRDRVITTAEFALGGLSSNPRRAINLAGSVAARFQGKRQTPFFLEFP